MFKEGKLEGDGEVQIRLRQHSDLLLGVLRIEIEIKKLARKQFPQEKKSGEEQKTQNEERRDKLHAWRVKVRTQETKESERTTWWLIHLQNLKTAVGNQRNLTYFKNQG